ncbi:divergent polysaccharide deacetylase family protein [Treponema sp.]|uniref:divergent polysaccharide deacetylase family protein n=1 Tax=Treponema sp. TaxID=166 RepID=UPI0038905533
MPKLSPTKRKTTPGKRKTSPKIKKPKVILAKSKVAVLCGLICGICVLAIGVNIFISTESSSPKGQQIQSLASTQIQPQNTVSQITKKDESAQKQISKPQKSDTPAQNSVSQQKKEISQIQKTEPASKESKQPKKNEVKKQENENQQQKAVQPQQNLSQQIKTIPENQISKTVSPKPQTSSNQVASLTPPKQKDEIEKNISKKRFDIPPASNGATIVIVIDDAGRNVENAKQYASLPFPITIAVLPKLAQSRACADAIRNAGKEVILHQPMQSLNHNLDPGPGKITSDMSTYEIAQIVKENLRELGPGVKGINNHEGSDVTSNEIKIGAVLEVCSEMGVYFLDSRTTAATKAPQAALERDMHIFEKAGPYLDNDIDRAKMIERMRETLAWANRHGRAIVIGHVDKSVKILPELLREMYPEIKAAGYRFATPSQLR